MAIVKCEGKLYVIEMRYNLHLASGAYSPDCSEVFVNEFYNEVIAVDGKFCYDLYLMTYDELIDEIRRWYQLNDGDGHYWFKRYNSRNYIETR